MAEKLINISAIKGEPGTGFEKRGGKGPFECGNCAYFGEGCSQKDMKAKSKQPRLPNGNVDVDADDCCEYIERIGNKGKSSRPVKNWKEAAEERAHGR